MRKHVRIKFGSDPTPDVDEDGHSLAYFWPDNKDKREETRETRLNNPHVYQAVYQCNPIGIMGRVFNSRDFLYYKQPPGYLESGYNDDAIRAWVEERGAYVAAGWDTAYSPLSNADYTAAVVGLLVPCQIWHREINAAAECRSHFDLYILDVIRRRIELPDLLTMVGEVQAKWQPRVHIVEKAASGISLLQVQLGPEIHTEDAYATMSKRDRALKGVSGGSTASWFRQGRIYFPDDSAHISWLQEFKNEIVDFTGEKGSTDDQVDALVHLCNHVIMQTANQIGMATSWSSLDRIDENMRYPIDDYPNVPKTDFNIFDIGMMLETPDDDPFAMTCGRCENYDNGFCKVHQQRFIAIDYCSSWTKRNK